MLPARIGDSRRVEKLRRDHPVEGFDCGDKQLNKYLLRFAWQNQQAGASQTYVGVVGDAIVGFHTLAMGQVTNDDAPQRLTMGLARRPVPLVLLARLAVDRCCQNQGVGKALLKDAMLRTLRAADIAGVRALTIHAKDDAANAFMSILTSSRRRVIRCICSFVERREADRIWRIKGNSKCRPAYTESISGSKSSTSYLNF